MHPPDSEPWQTERTVTEQRPWRQRRGTGGFESREHVDEPGRFRLCGGAPHSASRTVDLFLDIGQLFVGVDVDEGDVVGRLLHSDGDAGIHTSLISWATVEIGAV